MTTEKKIKGQARLSVDLDRRLLILLKAQAALRQTTIQEIVSDLVKKQIASFDYTLGAALEGEAT